MAKGVIVVDAIPKNCTKCKYRTALMWGEEHTCSITGEPLTDVEPREKSKHCPIKPLPATKSMFKPIDCSSRFDVDLAAVGWNECLKEIKGD